MRVLEKFSIYDMLIISLMATIGIGLKPVVSSIAHVISGPIMIPGGALAGGFYMLWLVVGIGITGKYGTGTLIGLVQALLVVFTGAFGNHGIFSIISYTMPGLVMDLVLLLMQHRVCCRKCAFVAGIAANVTGTFAVNFIFFSLPLPFLILTLLVASLSGGVGGLLAWELVRALKRHGLIKRRTHTKNIEGAKDD